MCPILNYKWDIILCKNEYYDVFVKCQSTIFGEFMFSQIDKILEELVDDRIEYMTEYLKRMLAVMEYDVLYTAISIMKLLGLKSKEIKILKMSVG